MYQKPMINRIKLNELKSLIIAQACGIGVSYTVKLTCPPTQNYTS